MRDIDSFDRLQLLLLAQVTSSIKVSKELKFIDSSTSVQEIESFRSICSNYICHLMLMITIQELYSKSDIEHCPGTGSNCICIGIVSKLTFNFKTPFSSAW